MRRRQTLPKPKRAPLAALLLCLACGGPSDVEQPDPVLLRVTPDTLDGQAATTTLRLLGEGFTRKSRVRYGESDFRPEFIGASELRLVLQREQALEPAAPVWVRVVTPPPGGGQSVSREIKRDLGIPAMSGISPARIALGDTATVLAVSGSNFTPHTTVHVWRGLSEDATEPYAFYRTDARYVSPERIELRIVYWSLWFTGTLRVHTANPEIGGTSNVVTLTVE